MIVYKNIKAILILAAFFSVSTTAFSQKVSDANLKQNVSSVQNALETIQRLEPKRFEYNVKKYNELKLPAGQHYGFLAEDVQRLLPELVRAKSKSYMVGKNRYQTATVQDTDMVSLIPLLVAAIQEQQKQIDQLKQELRSTSSTK